MAAAAACLFGALVAHCADTDNVTVEYTIYPATYVVDLLLSTYKWACLTDTTGDRCLSLVMQQTSVENSASPLDLCSACNLRLRRAVLDLPLGYRDALAADYFSLTSSTSATTTTAPMLPAWTDPPSLPRASGTRENYARYDVYDPPTRYGNPNACWWKANFWGSKLKRARLPSPPRI
ncbi:hypothetical protein VTI74DRAFT_9916 [Chaetomium olivicolor]